MTLLLQQIGRTRAALRSAKPRSRRRVELESRLRSLVTRQIRAEIRAFKVRQLKEINQ